MKIIYIISKIPIKISKYLEEIKNEKLGVECLIKENIIEHALKCNKCERPMKICSTRKLYACNCRILLQLVATYHYNNTLFIIEFINTNQPIILHKYLFHE